MLFCPRRALLCVAAGLAALTIALSVDLSAADQWIEVKSKHFTAISNAGDRSTRNLLWQLEQMRGAMIALWSWARADLNKPLTVIVVKDENSMRALAPEYWEKRGAVHPASLWLSGADQHYLVMRADVEVDARPTTNPYITTYFSYAGLVFYQSADRDLPYWFERGFIGVLSNTIVRNDEILVGPIIPWHLTELREQGRLPFAKLLSVSRRSPEVRQASFTETFDAQSWALVHFLMFGDSGKRASQLDAFIKMVNGGKDVSTAFAEALGTPDAIDSGLQLYVTRQLFQYRRIAIDVGVERGQFALRQMTPAESASARALFHAAMRRPTECRAAIAEARKADPNSAASYTAEGLLLDSEEKRDEAKAAYAKAVELGTSSAYAHYRLASLKWQPNPSQALLKEIEELLAKSIERNIRDAWSYAWLGDVRTSLGSPDGIALIRRAIALEPRAARHRLRAANILLFQGKAADARADAQAALVLAETDDERREAEELLARIAKAGA